MDFDQSKVRQFIAKAEAMERTMTRARAIAKIFFIFLIPFNNFFLQVSRGKPLLFYPEKSEKTGSNGEDERFLRERELVSG